MFVGPANSARVHCSSWKVNKIGYKKKKLKTQNAKTPMLETQSKPHLYLSLVEGSTPLSILFFFFFFYEYST